MDTITQYKRAVEAFRPVLAEVGDDRLPEPTPCSEWDVSGLLEHTFSAQRDLAAAIGGAPAGDGPVDRSERFEQVTSHVLAAYSAPGALDKAHKTPFGEQPGAMLLGLAVGDLFLHAWDLARALGRSTDLDPELAEVILERMRRTLPAAFRGEGKAFGPEQPVADDAPAADRLAAFTGRVVG